jgi:hypothetical protein
MLLKQHLFHHIELAITRKVLKTHQELILKTEERPEPSKMSSLCFEPILLLQCDDFASLKNESNYSE